jgi:hypothetical protein
LNSSVALKPNFIKLADMIYASYQGCERNLTDVLSERSEEFRTILNKNEEWYFDNVVSSEGKPHKEIVRLLFEKIDAESPRHLIVLSNKTSGYWINSSALGSGIDLNAEKYIRKVFHHVATLENQQKGLIFENYCLAMFKDIGVKAEKTRKSNDKGIDIIGRIKPENEDTKYRLIFHEDVLLLAQCKLFGQPVDTPIIRRLVGDSLFIRFSELDYVDVKHNALHLMVISYNGFTAPAEDFAKKNKVITLKFSDTTRIVSQIHNLKKSKAYRYVRLVGFTLSEAPP